jgi:hypothetical protein
MLHLFNKVYLETEERISLQENRAVISNNNGYIIGAELSNFSSGSLVYFSTSLDEQELPNIFLSLKEKSQESGKRCILYTDDETFVKIAAIWFKTITNFTKEEFTFWLKSFCYKERLNQKDNNKYNDNSYLNSFSKYIDIWDEVSPIDLNLGDVNYSYEFYFGSFLYNKKFSEKVKKTLSLFMRRSYIEIFLDAKIMILSNILDPKMQEFLGGSNKTLDNYQELPKVEIFLNENIWNSDKPLQVSNSASFNWENLNQELANKLTDTITDLHNNYENFVYDSSNLSKWKFLPYVLGKDLGDDELDEVIEDLLVDRGDQNFISKTDYENVNFVLWTHICNLKNSNETEKLFNYTLK